MADSSPEVQRQLAEVSALRAQLARLEQSIDSSVGPDYLGKYREFKYRETLFDLFTRQYEIARIDESREGALIQVVDAATAPEVQEQAQAWFHRRGGNRGESPVDRDAPGAAKCMACQDDFSRLIHAEVGGRAGTSGRRVGTAGRPRCSGPAFGGHFWVYNLCSMIEQTTPGTDAAAGAWRCRSGAPGGAAIAGATTGTVATRTVRGAGPEPGQGSLRAAFAARPRPGQGRQLSPQRQQVGLCLCAHPHGAARKDAPDPRLPVAQGSRVRAAAADHRSRCATNWPTRPNEDSNVAEPQRKDLRHRPPRHGRQRPRAPPASRRLRQPAAAHPRRARPARPARGARASWPSSGPTTSSSPRPRSAASRPTTRTAPTSCTRT